jgi:hypothetical protein
MIVTPRPATRHEMLELLEEPDRARAAVFKEMFPMRFADRYFRWPSWLLAAGFVVSMIAADAVRPRSRSAFDVLLVFMFIDVVLLELGALIAVGEVYVCLFSAFARRREISQRVGPTIDRVVAALRGCAYLCAERRRYCCRVISLFIPALVLWFALHFDFVTAKQIIVTLQQGDIGWAVGVASCVYVAGAMAAASVWCNKIYLLTSAIGDNGAFSVFDWLRVFKA